MYQIDIIVDPFHCDLRQDELFEQIYRFRPRLKARGVEVQRTPKGKPFIVFRDSGRKVPRLHMSVSHSGEFWACVLCSRCCGLDLQQIKMIDYEKLSARFFTENENNYVKRAGLQGFYALWTRREALAKYTGLGFFGMRAERPELVDEECRPVRTAVWDGRSVIFEEIEAPEGYMAVWCTEEGEIE